jgi:hypothetical protein
MGVGLYSDILANDILSADFQRLLEEPKFRDTARIYMDLIEQKSRVKEHQAQYWVHKIATDGVDQLLLPSTNFV